MVHYICSIGFPITSAGNEADTFYLNSGQVFVCKLSHGIAHLLQTR